MRDGGLALAQWLDEVADTDFARGGGRQDAEHLQADRVGQRGESGRQLGGVRRIEWRGQDRGAAGRGGRAGGSFVDIEGHRARVSRHGCLPLTVVNVSSILDASTDVNTDGGPDVPSPTGTERREPR